MTSYLKQPTYRSEKWLRAVASLPCQRCGVEGMTQAAHRNEHKSLGKKVDDSWVAGLCASCHWEIDQGAKMTREERRYAMDQAILYTLRELTRRGLVGPK